MTHVVKQRRGQERARFHRAWIRKVPARPQAGQRPIGEVVHAQAVFVARVGGGGPDLLDEAERAISEGVREMACRLNRGSTSFAMTAANLARAAHLMVSKETLRKLIEAEGKAVLKAQQRGELAPDWEATDCKSENGKSRVYLGSDGVMVPLVWGYTVLDLAERFGLEAVVVGRAGLGTLNHVAMTVMMLRSYQIPIRGIVLNGRSAEPDLAESTNPAALARMLHGVRIVEVPHDPAGPPIASASRILSRLL